MEADCNMSRQLCLDTIYLRYHCGKSLGMTYIYLKMYCKLKAVRRVIPSDFF